MCGGDRIALVRIHVEVAIHLVEQYAVHGRVKRRAERKVRVGRLAHVQAILEVVFCAAATHGGDL